MTTPTRSRQLHTGQSVLTLDYAHLGRISSLNDVSIAVTLLNGAVCWLRNDSIFTSLDDTVTLVCSTRGVPNYRIATALID